MMKSLNFFTPRGTVRLTFAEELSVEAYGSYFTVPFSVLSCSVSDRYLIVIGEDGRLSAYGFDGELAFSGETVGITSPLISGTVMTASDALPLAERHGVLLAPDHAYYLATAEDYRMTLLDLVELTILF